MRMQGADGQWVAFLLSEPSSCFTTVYVKQHFGCVKPKFPGAVGLSVRNTHCWSLKQLSGCFSCNSKHTSGCSPCWSGVWQHSPLLSNWCSLSEAELSFSHLPFHGSKQCGNSGIFLTFKNRKGGKKHHFTNFTFSVGSRAFSASFCSFHWPTLVRSHISGCYHTSSVPTSM